MQHPRPCVRSVAVSVAVAVAVLADLVGGPVALAYPVPAPLPPGQPGEIIQTENLGAVTGGTRYRIIHHSRSVAGEDIAVSGLVFVPSTPAPPTGRPILAWAHGTTGVADVCAPSLGGYDPEYLDDWLAAGYVVTATDYEGMGTPGRHPYLVGESEGRGVLDSIRAALVMPETSARNDEVIFGHSQGGHAALFANELAPIYAPELHVHGTVAAAPASQIEAAWAIATSGPVVRSAVIMAGAGFAQSYPSLDLGAIYTDVAIARLGVVDTGCQDAVVNAYADLTQDQMIEQLPGAVPAWHAAINASEPGFRVGAGPVLLLHGTADEEVPYEASQTLSPRLCATGQAHEFITYPGQSHSGIFGPAHHTVVDWVAARFAGAVPPDLCATDQIPPPAAGPGECATTLAPVPFGLAAISGPAASQAASEPTAIDSPFTVTAPAAVQPGDTITYTATPSASLKAMATTLLEDRVKPVIKDQYGDALANSAWVTIELDRVATAIPVPPGTAPVGEPVVTGTTPKTDAVWSDGFLAIAIPTLTVDSRQAPAWDSGVSWTVGTAGLAPGAVVDLPAGPMTFAMRLTIGVTFYGSALSGGMTAPFTCLPVTEPMAVTDVVGATPVAAVVVAVPALTA